MPPSQLLTRVEIGSFRGLRDAALDGMVRFNLIVGGNDSGKTSLLEAIGLLCAPFDLLEWAYIARMREARTARRSRNSAELKETIYALRWLFPSVPEADSFGPILLDCDGLPYLSSIRAEAETISRLSGSAGSEDTMEVVEEGLHVGVRAKTSSDEFGREFDPWHEFDIWPSEGLKRARNASRARTPYAMIRPFGHRSEPVQVTALSRSIESGTKDRLLQLLKMVDTGFLDIDIITSSYLDRPMVLVTHASAGRVPLSVMGDGFRRALSIALGLERARGGVLLIDEIEAALHVSVLDDIFPWLLAAAAEFDVQIIATTHSLEAVQVIADAGSRDPANAVNAYHLDPTKPSERRVKRYTNDMLSRLVRDRGLDIRGR